MGNFLTNVYKDNVYENFASWCVVQIDLLTTVSITSDIDTYAKLFEFILQKENLTNHNIRTIRNNYCIITDKLHTTICDIPIELFNHMCNINVSKTLIKTHGGFNMAGYPTVFDDICIDLNIDCDKYILKAISSKLDIAFKIAKLDELLILHNEAEKYINNSLSCNELYIKIVQINKIIADKSTSINDKIIVLDELTLITNQLNLLKINITNKKYMSIDIKKLTMNILNYKSFMKVMKLNNIKKNEYIINQQITKLKKESNENLLKLMNNVLNHNTINEMYLINFHFQNIITSYNIHSFVSDLQYFNIKNNFTLSSTKIINLEINHEQTGKDLITYLYTRELNIDDDKINRLKSMIILSDFLMIDNLHDLCSNMLDLLLII